MSSYRQLLYHIIFRTKDSKPTLSRDWAEELYSYFGGIIRNKNSQLYQINGVANHLHILTDIHPSLALSDFVREMKVSSSVWIKEKTICSSFSGWAEGYGSFTCSYMDLGRLIDYVKNQEEHHKKRTFEEEYRNLIMESGVKIDERYFP